MTRKQYYSVVIVGFILLCFFPKFALLIIPATVAALIILAQLGKQKLLKK